MNALDQSDFSVSLMYSKDDCLYNRCPYKLFKFCITEKKIHRRLVPNDENNVCYVRIKCSTVIILTKLITSMIRFKASQTDFQLLFHSVENKSRKSVCVRRLVMFLITKKYTPQKLREIFITFLAKFSNSKTNELQFS